MSTTSPSADALRTAILELMADGQVRSLSRIAADCGDQPGLDGDDAVDRVIDVVENIPTFATLDGENVFDLPAVLAGRVFTHRVSAVERTHGVLPLSPDLALVALLEQNGTIEVEGLGATSVVYRVDGLDDESVADDIAVGGALVVGSDQLTAILGEGETLAVHVESGAIRLAAHGEGADPAAMVETLRERFEGATDDDEPVVGLVRLLLTWILDDRALFTEAGAPLDELLAGAGLDRRGDWIGPADTEWLTPTERHTQQVEARNTEIYGFDECCHQAFDEVEAAFSSDVEQIDRQAVGRSLGHGEVAAAFLTAELSGAGHHVGDIAEDLVAFTNALLDRVEASVAPSALYVRATALDCLGRVADAEADIRQALRIDGNHRRSLITAAGYADDRGDARRALEHLRRAGLEDDHPQIARLQTIVNAEPTKVGRNAPCPCGSGRKYKACCIDKSLLPAAIQAEWLYAKIVGFALHPARRGVAEHLAIHAIERAGGDEDVSARVDEDVRLAELASFDGDVIDWFITERSALLPRIERDLADDWRGEPLRLLDVTAVDGQVVDVHDRISDVTLTASAFSFDEVTAGSTIVARVLPVDGGAVLGGPITEVPAEEIAAATELIQDDETSAHDWAEWIGHIDAVTDGAAEGPFVRSEGHHHHAH